jgi:hypothetical protein
MTTFRNLARRCTTALAAGAILSGCAVYGPPYAAYAPAPYVHDGYYPYDYYPYRYGGPVYVGPPVSLDFGYYQHRYHGGHAWYGAPYAHGRGWGHATHGGYHGGWRGRR